MTAVDVTVWDEDIRGMAGNIHNDIQRFHAEKVNRELAKKNADAEDFVLMYIGDGKHALAPDGTRLNGEAAIAAYLGKAENAYYNDPLMGSFLEGGGSVLNQFESKIAGAAQGGEESSSYKESVLVYEAQSVNGKAGTAGKLNWYDVGGDGSWEQSGSWDAVSGSSTLGSILSGEWTLSNYRNRAENEYKKDGVGFTVNITPDPKWGRSLLRIHPDGNRPGTTGCIGLTGNGDALK